MWITREELMGPRAVTVLVLTATLACGDDPTEPALSGPGYVLSVSIPGVTDTTFQGDSVYWRYISGPNPVLGRRRELILTLLVLHPPAPLLSPLVLETRWYHIPRPLPDLGSYDLTGDATGGVYLQANSNVGTWASSSGHIQLSEVTDTSLRGYMQATLTQIYPAERYLPDVELRATFWAPHSTDRSVD
ncbi:MAG TPA: hypothetical protein VF252_09945 [Gemmatimonadales bacterium]